jgi:prepilin-type processing-associated H-X9-DG protein
MKEGLMRDVVSQKEGGPPTDGRAPTGPQSTTTEDGCGKPSLNKLAVASAALGGAQLVTLLLVTVMTDLFVSGHDGSLGVQSALSVLQMLLSSLAVVLGAVALVQIRTAQRKARGREFAVAGIAAGLGFSLLLLVTELIVLAPIAGVIYLVMRLTQRRARPRPPKAEIEALGQASVQCPECGQHNPVGAVRCEFCGEVVGAGRADAARSSAKRPISGLAIAAAVLAVLTFPTFGLSGIPGVIIGIAALVQIHRGQGKLGGAWLAGSAVGVSLVLLGMIIIPMYAREATSSRKITCLSNVKSLAMAMQMYADDNGSSYPPAGDWCGKVRQYVRNDKIFVCPSASNIPCGYAFPGTKSEVQESDPANQVTIFESDRGWNAAGGPELLTDVPRHLGGDNVGFADGHAAWLARVRIKPDDPKSGWRKAYPETYHHLQWKP